MDANVTIQLLLASYAATKKLSIALVSLSLSYTGLARRRSGIVLIKVDRLDQADWFFAQPTAYSMYPVLSAATKSER